MRGVCFTSATRTDFAASVTQASLRQYEQVQHRFNTTGSRYEQQSRLTILKTLSSPRGLRWGAWLLLLVLPGIPAHARAHHGETWARDRFAAAERMREALNGRLPADRPRHDYQRVINAYRAVYFGAPASTKADPSVVAVAENLVESGRRFGDGRIPHTDHGRITF